MAHKKGMSSTRNGRDSHSKRLGVKKHDGEVVIPGIILLRQRGTRFWPGAGVARGSDDTLYSKVYGVVKYKHRTKNQKMVVVLPCEQEGISA